MNNLIENGTARGPPATLNSGGGPEVPRAEIPAEQTHFSRHVQTTDFFENDIAVHKGEMYQFALRKLTAVEMATALQQSSSSSQTEARRVFELVPVAPMPEAGDGTS